VNGACPKCGFSSDAQVTARWSLTLPKRIESANAYTVNKGNSRWRYSKARDEWQWLVKAAVLSLIGKQSFRLGHARPSGKRRVTITRHYAGRCQEIDRDNLGVKPLVDALVREGVIHDDAPAWLELHVMQERGERNETTVEVEELA
jgi:Holliday junction resolvase RusA-like endonuclease